MQKAIALLAVLLFVFPAFAQPDTVAQRGARSLSLKATHWSRGEYRVGALPDENGQDMAMFLTGKSILQFDFSHGGFEMRIAPKYSGVWGSRSNGGLGINEAWAGVRHPSGLFLRVGRQKLEYDDERIIGDDDWTMATNTHDVLKTGFEAGRHKLHLLLAFNQNDENVNGGTRYVDGGQVYKSMQTLWYHVDPMPQLGASLIFMNTGMQNMLANVLNKTEYQQIFGAFLSWHPRPFEIQASYYRQTGYDEYSLPIHAWMTSAEAVGHLGAGWDLNAGYFFMSGDDYYIVPREGEIGLARKTQVLGFNPIFGSHHEFYGAMDFFYVTTYYGGNSPGLQDGHLGFAWRPAERFEMDATYHLLATGVKVRDTGKVLGHELELNVSLKLSQDVKLQAGYSFMKGTETMKRLKRTGERNHLHWGWLMLIVTPEIFSLTK